MTRGRESQRPGAIRSSRAGRPIAELGLLVAVGLFLGLIGPYGTGTEAPASRIGFWLFVIVAGGLAGMAIEHKLKRRPASRWARLFVAATLLTPVATAIVFLAMVLLLAHEHESFSTFTLHLLWQVFIISLAVMGLRTLIFQEPERIVETRTVIAPPLPDAEASFRSRLSAKRRSARLLAVEAHDHYVRVHTDAGVELIGLRFADALRELAFAHGYRVHRSWWVRADAITAARWRRGSGQLDLEGDLAVPVSRSGAPVLREAGWL